MRKIKFVIYDQNLELDPTSVTDDLVPGTEGYVVAEFVFSDIWRNYVKVAAFYSMLGHEYAPQKLDGNLTCVIPAEALAKRRFKVQILGKSGDLRIQTNKITIDQNGGKK